MVIIVVTASGDVMAWHRRAFEKATMALAMVIVQAMVCSSNEGGSTSKGRWQQEISMTVKIVANNPATIKAPEKNIFDSASGFDGASDGGSTWEWVLARLLECDWVVVVSLLSMV